MNKNKSLFLVSLLVLIMLCSNTIKPRTIFMIGDSTMANKPERGFPEHGWGMDLGELLKPDAIVQNYAVNGRSSKSFLAEGRWDSVCNKLTKGDYVIIQFGHNDAKQDSARHTNPQTTYKQNLRKFISDTRSRGGNPILCTSIVRRHFGPNGKLIDTHGGYPQAMREVAAEMNVPLVDLQKLTEKNINKLGSEESKKLFMILSPGEYPNFPEGKADSTHLRIEGAKMVAKFFVKESVRQKLSIKTYFNKF